MPNASTSIGSLPKVWTPSTWNATLCSRAMRPISGTGWTVPTSELACMIEISMVSGRIARRTSSGSTRPVPSTGR